MGAARRFDGAHPLAYPLLSCWMASLEDGSTSHRPCPGGQRIITMRASMLSQTLPYVFEPRAMQPTCGDVCTALDAKREREREQENAHDGQGFKVQASWESPLRNFVSLPVQSHSRLLVDSAAEIVCFDLLSTLEGLELSHQVRHICIRVRVLRCLI